MDEGFRDYFRERTDQFEAALGRQERLFPSDRGERLAPEVAVQAGLEAARRTASEHGLDLREDAQLLIAILAQELVARPVALVTPEDAESVPSILTEDVQTIVVQAGETVDDGEVSAHAVIDGLSSSWDQLRSSNLRVWDRHRGDR